MEMYKYMMYKHLSPTILNDIFVPRAIYSNTPCLSASAESIPDSFPVKIWPVYPLPSEKNLNFLPPQYIIT